MTQDGPVVLRDGQIEVITQQEADLLSGKTQTAGQIGREAVRDEEIVERGTILPIGRTASGDVEFALPEVLAAFPEAFATGVAALSGAPITGQELAETTLATAIPATGGITGVKRVATAVQKIPKSVVKKSASTNQLLKQGSKLIDDYKKTGDAVSGDDFSMFWVKADDVMKKSGFDAETTPAIARQMASLARRAENEFIEPQDMSNIRRGIRSLMKSQNIEPEDKRLAAILLDEFDSFAMQLPGGKGWREGRKIYAQGKKSQQIEDALVFAGEQASGLENGIRIALRQILRSKKKSLGFTKAEKDTMRAIVRGNRKTNTLKKLSMLSFGSGQQRNPFATLGQIAGIGAGATVGGAPGAIAGGVVLPAVGSVAQRSLEKSTVQAVNALRALIAGAKVPERLVFKDTQLTPRVLSGLAAAGVSEGP